MDIGTSDFAYPGRLRVFSDTTKHSVALLPSLDVNLITTDASGQNGLLLAHNPPSKTYNNGTGLWWMPKQGDSNGNRQGIWFAEATLSGSTLYGIGFQGPSISNRYWFYDTSSRVIFDFRPDDRFIYFRPAAGNLSGIRLMDSDGSNWTDLTANPSTLSNVTYKFPSGPPTSPTVDDYDVLTASSTGQMVWKEATGKGKVMYATAPTLTPQLWSAFGGVTYSAGTVIYCSNCTPGSCSTVGNGALAIYTATGWACK